MNVSNHAFRWGVCLFLSIAFVRLATAGDAAVGLRLGFVGGPMLSLEGSVPVSDNTEVYLSVGGFPGAILRVESNVRLWRAEHASPFMQFGLGYSRFFRGKGKNESIKDLHLSVGWAKEMWRHYRFSFDVGVLYAPKAINPYTREEFPDVFPMIPFLALDALYKVR